MKDNDESIFGTRPWKIFGEGPAQGFLDMSRANLDLITRHITFGNAISIPYLFRNSGKLLPDFFDYIVF